MILQSWGPKVNPELRPNTAFQVNKKIPKREVSQADWAERYRVSLRPFGEMEWIEYLEYEDFPGKVLIVLKNGPLSKDRNLPRNVLTFPSKIPKYIKNGEGHDFSSVKIKAIYYIKASLK